MNIGILASGNGTNLQAIIDAQTSGRLSAKVSVVIVDKENAYALERAKKHRIPHAAILKKNYPDKETFEEALITTLKQHQVDWVVLAGFMRILSPAFIRHFPQRIVNIHPSLLPAFPGLNAIEQAWRYGVKITGCTIHLVDEGCDTGPILAQQPVSVANDENLESLTEAVHRAEHALYPQVLEKISQGKITGEGRRFFL